MKKTRRIAAMIAALALATCSIAPIMMTASAVDTTSVTVDTSNDNGTAHTYSAYQIFVGSYDANLGLKVTAWGTGYDSTGLLADTNFTGLVITSAKEATGTEGEEGYVPATPAVTVGSFLGDKTDAASVAQAIEKLGYNTESSDADALATILGNHIGSATVKTLSETAENLSAGYWIVLDKYTANADTTEEGNNPNPNAVSKHMLKISGKEGAITITPKKSYPTVVKKVKENTNVSDYEVTVNGQTKTYGDYNDVADYNIGDAVPFALYGTMPSTYDDYDHYYYSFGDTLASEFDLDTNSIVVTVLNKGEEEVDETVLGTTDYTIETSSAGFDLTIMDTKAFDFITKDSMIVVTYNATLNKSAVIGLDGQENKVDLEYSNNPYKTGDGKTKPEETDKTPEDKVIVFTYEQDILKTDAATAAALEDAVFTLSRTRTVDGEEVTEYVKVDAANKVDGWTTVEAEASELRTDENGICKVIGLDDTIYTLKEKTPPEGYNALSNPITLSIAATTNNGQNWDGAASSALTAINLTVTGDTSHAEDSSSDLPEAVKNAKGTVKATIKNDKGVNLPETGGIGTVLFYTVGGVLVAGAGVVLVTKKRLGKED